MNAQLLDNFQITHNFSTPYHPQTDGLVERFNRTLCESLAKLSTNTNEWDEYISPVLFAYRTSKQSTTKITPFYLTYGREAKLPIDDLSENVEQIEQCIQNLLDILLHERESAIKRIEVQQFKKNKDMINMYDMKLIFQLEIKFYITTLQKKNNRQEN